MNYYDINDPKGMRQAVLWTNKTMRQIKDGGTWVIPRSGTVVTKVSGKAKTCHYKEGFASDLSIAKVLKAAGWTFVSAPTTKGGEQPDGCQ
jgi:hypothetical protein